MDILEINFYFVFKSIFSVDVIHNNHNNHNYYVVYSTPAIPPAIFKIL